MAHRAVPGKATCSWREGEVSKSGLEALPARRRRFADDVRNTWLPTRFHLSFASSQAARHRQRKRRRTRFSTPTNREPTPGPPVSHGIDEANGLEPHSPEQLRADHSADQRSNNRDPGVAPVRVTLSGNRQQEMCD